MDKWQQVPVFNSSFSDHVRDIILVNIDTEEKLVFIVLYDQSISKYLLFNDPHIDWFYPFLSKVSKDGKSKTTIYKEKRIEIDGKV